MKEHQTTIWYEDIGSYRVSQTLVTDEGATVSNQYTIEYLPGPACTATLTHLEAEALLTFLEDTV